MSQLATKSARTLMTGCLAWLAGVGGGLLGPAGPVVVVVVVVAGVVVGMSSGCSTPGDDPGPALPVEPATIYAQMCARCHGVDGRGDPELRKTLPVRDFSDPTFQARATSDDIGRTIMAGKNQMPAFGGMLSPPKIQSLSGFVKRLGRAAPMGAAPVTKPPPPPSAGR